MFILVRNWIMHQQSSKAADQGTPDDGIFDLFDCYFKMLTKNLSPVDSANEENASTLKSFETWTWLWQNKNSDHDRHISKINEALLFQLNILIYQITSFFDVSEQNYGSFNLIRNMVIVITSIYRTMDKVPYFPLNFPLESGQGLLEKKQRWPQGNFREILGQQERDQGEPGGGRQDQ
jgi:hypothetical protein